MDILTKLNAQLRAMWERSSVGYRAALIAAAVVSLITIVGVGYWASRPQYMPLASDLTPAEAARIMEKLDAANIPYEKSFSASIIYVPERRYSDATVAAKDVMGVVQADDDGSGSSLWDPDMKEARLLRQKERALAASILRMPSIATADVHIAMPEREIFVSEEKPTKASVVIGMRRGETLSVEQAATIANLVAASVEQLTNENVTVTDANGRTVYPDGSVADQGLSRQYRHKRQVEADLVAKAETILTQMLGPGRAIVRVYADLDFTETERTDVKIDKASAAKTKETIKTSETKGPQVEAVGAAGTGSNLNAAATRNTVPVSTSEETIDTEFDNPRTTDIVRQFGGTVKRLTISAGVDLPQPDPNATPPVPELKIADIEQLIQNAVGFDTTRGDTIAVIRSALPGADNQVVTLVDTPNRWDFYNNLVRNASLGLAAVVALVLGILTIRKLQPMQALRGREEEPSTSRAGLLDELSEQAKQNPEIVSKIVAAWLNTPATIPMPNKAGEEQAAETAPAERRAAA